MYGLLQDWFLPAALILVGGIGVVLFARLLLLPLRALPRSVREARGASTDDRLLRPVDALALTTGATAFGTLLGTATATALGGPGAVTWIMIGGLASAAVRYTEAAVSWQHRTLYDDGKRMSASVAPLLRSLSASAGRPLAMAWGVLAIAAIALSVGATGSAELAKDLAPVLGRSARFVPVALGVLALAVAFRPPAAIVRRLALPVLALVGVTALVFAIAALTSASRIPGAFGRILEQAFTGGAPAAGFLGALWGETFRLGLTRGIVTGSSFGVGAALHGGAGAQSAHRAGLVASLEPLIASVLLPLIVGLAVVSTRAWNTQNEMSTPLSDVRAFLREPASAAELQSEELALDGMIRVREGQSFDRFFLGVHRGLINEPRFQIDGAPWDGAIRFEDGHVTQLLEPQGRFGALDRVDMKKTQSIRVLGEGKLVGVSLLGRTLSELMPTRWGAPFATGILLALGLVFALALVIAADSVGGGLFGSMGALGSRVLAAGAIATAPFWARGTIAVYLPIVTILAAIPWAIALAAAIPRVVPLEDGDEDAARGKGSPRKG